MKKIIFFLFAIIIMTPKFILGQFGWITEIPGPEREIGLDVTQATDGNYAVILRAEGGLGNGLDAGNYLVKLDNGGNVLLVKKYSSKTSYIQGINPTPQNGFLINYLSIDDNTNINQTYISKLDENGEEEWTSMFLWEGDSIVENRITNIITTSDGGYVLAGQTRDTVSLNPLKTFVRKVDNNFNEVWTFESNGTLRPSHITKSNDGAIGITGIKSDTSGSPTTYILKLDEDGNQIFETNFSEVFVSSQIVRDFAGGFIATHILSGSSPKAVRVDNFGNILWTKDVTADTQLAPFNPVTDIVSVGDGFLYSTFTPNSLFNVNDDILFVKLDYDGNIIWEKTQSIYSSSIVESCPSFISTSDNGFVGISHAYNPTPIAASFVFKMDSLGSIYSNKIIGKVSLDEQPNCLVDANEAKISNWIVSAESTENSYFSILDSLGNYCIPLDTGSYLLTIHPPNNLWLPCNNNIPINVSSYDTITQDFPMETMLTCPSLYVNSVFSRARPCFENRQTIYYCNQGTNTAENAYLEIEIDSKLSYVSSSIPLTTQAGNIYTFDLGDISISQCGSFYIDYFLDCNTTIGESICIESHIFPDSTCLPNQNWNGAFVEVDAYCQDSIITFYLENVGLMDMPTSKEYIVIEDAILLISDDFQLLAGEQDSFSVTTNNTTFIMAAEQVEDAPGDPYPTAWVEGCSANGSNNFSIGFVNQFSLGDNTPAVDIDCTIASNSYDPNDKQGYPLGYSDEHFIRPNTDLEYLIRFQNTGTDTAFTVVIRDTIAPELDIPSIQVGASSHPYEWRIYGENILEFTFNVIMLPDSNVNEPASHGFIEFKISQKEDLPLGTVIKNDAAIYFDYNDPIITNETFHTLGENFITVSIQRPIEEDYSLLVRPNPLQEFAIFEMKKEIKNGLFELYDVSGKLAWQQKFSGSEFELKRNNLNAGIYFYKISENGNAINSGKIIVN